MRRWLIPLTMVVLTLALGSLFFAPALWENKLYYLGDTARVYLPQRVALAQALREGRLPWWSAQLGVGYPLLAEGQVGALYPVNWLLALLVAPAVASNAATLLHYLIAAAGAYLFLRALPVTRGVAFLGALVWTLGGFQIAHLSHLSVLASVSWLPWSFAATQRILMVGARHVPLHRAERLGQPCVGARHASPLQRRLGLYGGLAGSVTLQILAGHVQMALLGLLALGFYALFLAATAPLASHSTGEEACVGARHASPLQAALRLVAWAKWLGAVALGVLLAAPQWLAGWQLSALSQRAGGLESSFFTSFSFHPLLLVTYLLPFLRGNPYPLGSVELMPYLGLLPLALAGVALGRARDRAGWFWAGLGLVGVALAAGRWNPFYQVLRAIPLLNLFRVPARYLLWTNLALVVLAAQGAEALRREMAARGDVRVERVRSWCGWALLSGVGGAALLAVGVALAAPDAEALVAAWRWLPLLLAVATALLLLAARRLPAWAWLAGAILLVGADLYAYQGVLARTFNAPLPAAEVQREVAASRFFAAQEGLYRLCTKEEITPALSVMRESFYPNLALGAGLASANLYLPLVPQAYQEYLAGLDAARLNRLNVGYYLIPQLLPVDEASELYDVHNPLAALPCNRWVELPPLELAGLEVESYLSHAAELPQGTLAAEVVLREADGRETVIPLRAGIETAEWAYERSDVARVVAHQRPPLATTWPARSGFPPEEHAGHTYLATARFSPPLRPTALLLRVHLPAAFARLEKVRLREQDGGTRLLTHLLGLGDHTIVYRGEDVLIYRNEDVWPRAYTVPTARLTRDPTGLALPSDLARADLGPVEVLRYQNQAVALRARLVEPGYLVLADLHYPGWRATVDGQAATILPVDRLWRAVLLPAGEHRIEFAYHPSLVP